MEEMVKPFQDQLPSDDLYVMRGALEDIRKVLSDKKKNSPSRVTAHEDAILTRVEKTLGHCDK